MMTEKQRLSCAVLFYGTPDKVATLKTQIEDLIRMGDCKIVHVQLSQGRLFITTGKEQNGQVEGGRL